MLYPFGGVRTDLGSITQTDLGYTGQRNNSYRNLFCDRIISLNSFVPFCALQLRKEQK